MERKTQQTSAAVAGMSVRSARKWQCGPLPSESGQERRWCTRPGYLCQPVNEYVFAGRQHADGPTSPPPLTHRDGVRKMLAYSAPPKQLREPSAIVYHRGGLTWAIPTIFS